MEKREEKTNMEIIEQIPNLNIFDIYDLWLFNFFNELEKPKEIKATVNHLIEIRQNLTYLLSDTEDRFLTGLIVKLNDKL